MLFRSRSDGSFEHEVVVVDTPATGHALAITQLPEVLLKIIPGGPISTAVREGLALLTDPRHTGALVVTLPETLPVSEALELIDGLRRGRVPLSGVVVNRMPQDPFTEDERGHAERINAAEGPLFGARALRRLERSAAAFARLRGGVELPVVTVPELASQAPALAEEIALCWRGPAPRQEVAR